MENFEMRQDKSNEQAGFVVPESEISERFSRSGGKGGQNVNKLSTKAELRWNVDNSRALTEEEKERIKQVLGSRINKEGELIVVSQEERSQFQNRQLAVARMNELVSQALTPEKERIPTEPTRASEERRLEEKKHQKEKKFSRQQQDLI